MKPNQFEVIYSENVDILDIWVIDCKVDHTSNYGDNMLIRFNKRNEIVGIEIFEATKFFR